MQRKTKKAVEIEEEVQEQPVKEEVQEVLQPEMLRWQKVGGGSLNWGNKIIKPGQVFEARLEDLPKAFMDTLVCLDPEALKNIKAGIVKETQTPESLYVMQKSKEKGMWDVVNEHGKAINETPLTNDLAKELLTALNK